MRYKKVAGFENYDVLEPAIKDINVLDFQTEIVNECVDVPFKLIGSNIQDQKYDNQDKERFEISDAFVTVFTIFTLTVGIILCAISWFW